VVVVVLLVLVVVVVGTVGSASTRAGAPARSERVFHQNVAACGLLESCRCVHLYVPLHVAPFVTVNSESAIGWSSPSKKPGCLQTPTRSIPVATSPWVVPSSTSPAGHEVPIVNVALDWLNEIEPEVESEPLFATRGAATNSQSRRWFVADVRAATWFASLVWSIAL